MSKYKHPLGLKILGAAWFLGAGAFDCVLWVIGFKSNFGLAIVVVAAVVLLAIIGVATLIWETWP